MSRVARARRHLRAGKAMALQEPEMGKAKSEIRSTKQARNPNDQMTESKGRKQYDLEPRTLAFAKRVRSFIRRLPRTLSNAEDGRQLIRK